MASYSGIHVESRDTEVIAGAIEGFERDVRGRRIKRIPADQAWVDRLNVSGAGFLVAGFAVGPPVGSWTEIIASQSAYNLKKLCLDLSQRLQIRTVAFGYQTTAGQHYYHVCVKGRSMRLVWFTHGEPLHEEMGEALDVEKKLMEENRTAVPEEDMKLEYTGWEDLDSSAKLSFYLPTCEKLAERIGCTSFEARRWHVGVDVGKGTCIKSWPRWWIFGG